MSKQTYIGFLTYFQTHPTLARLILIIGSICPLVTMVSYSLFLLLLIIQKDPWLLKAILIPAPCFMTTTLLRKLFNARRPFEVYELTPLKPHDNGESFPSRHSASAMIIALTILFVQPLWGIVLFVNAIIIGLSRIFLALHFPRDVIGGFLLAFLFGLFFLL